MTFSRLPILLVALLVAVLPFCAAPGQPPSPKEFLLHVTKGQVPTDTGMDDKTVAEIVDSKELGGKALKVPFAPGDSFGVRPGPAKNWKPFVLFRFNAFNPSSTMVALELTVIHARSTSYQTRVVAPIKLRPGKNEVKLGIDEMTNVNGSAPDLSGVTKWYILDADKKGPTIFFSDIWLEGGQGTSTAKPSVAVSGDPARLARIRAASMPKVDKVIEFHTPAADAICSALEVFPPNNPWNLVVDAWPLHPDSKNIIASIGPEKPLRYNDDMGFIIVPPGQAKIDVKLVGYPDESDKGPYPVPDNVPIEGWPANFQRRPGAKLTLDDVQRDKLNENSDRHAVVLDPTNRMLYEFYQMKKTDQGWQAACAAIFDLKSNKMRPDGWTSTDAAGLPIFPAVVRYDELQRGLVEHALRVTVRNTRRAYVYPATHFASSKTDENLPRMGERLRLRRDFDTAGFSPELQAILKGLKKYGMFVADNGIDWAISVTPDPRIPVLHDEFRKLKGSDFEVVVPPTGYTPPE